MYHQVDKLDKVQEDCFGGYGPAVYSRLSGGVRPRILGAFIFGV